MFGMMFFFAEMIGFDLRQDDTFPSSSLIYVRTPWLKFLSINWLSIIVQVSSRFWYETVIYSERLKCSLSVFQLNSSTHLWTLRL